MARALTLSVVSAVVYLVHDRSCLLPVDMYSSPFFGAVTVHSRRFYFGFSGSTHGTVRGPCGRC